MSRGLTAAFTVFVTGGLLTGLLGVSNLTSLLQVAVPPAAAETTPVNGAPPPAPPPTRPALPVLPIPGLANPVTPTPAVASSTSSTSSTTTSAGQATAGGWEFLYVVAGDVWETTPAASIQLTQDGQVGQPALGDSGLAFVERTRNASDIWLASADGPPRSITRDSSAIIAQNHWASQPVFVPGRQRLYVLGDFNKSATGEGDLAIWEAGLTPSSPVQITHPPAYTGGDQDVTPNPQNPEQIIFTRYAYAGTQLVEQLQWLDVSVGAAQPLTSADQPSRQASYAPDGSEVAFIQQGPGSEQDLYVAHIQVTAGQASLDHVQQVVPGVCADPVWSPDGTQLAYVALAHDQFQLWSVAVQVASDGTESFGDPRQVTGGASVDAASRPVFLTSAQADAVRQWLAARSDP